MGSTPGWLNVRVTCDEFGNRQMLLRIPNPPKQPNMQIKHASYYYNNHISPTHNATIRSGLALPQRNQNQDKLTHQGWIAVMAAEWPTKENRQRQTQASFLLGPMEKM